MATASEPDNKTFNYSNMDWEGYVAHRPRYKANLYDRIYQHHTENGGAYDSALDVGAGVGIVTKDLLQRFAHVTLSDPSEDYVSQAKAIFSRLPDPSRVSFVQAKLEDLTPSQLPLGPVDLITAGECLHWADIDACATAAAQLVKPHGTFAAWLYGIRPIFPRAEPGAKSFDAVFDKFFELYETIIEPVGPAFRPGRTMNARLDTFPFAPSEWRDVERVYAHPDSETVSMNSPRFGTPASRVRKGEEREEWLPGEGLFAEDADFEWLENYFENLIPPLRMKKNARAKLDALKEAMGRRTVRLMWPMGLVIATRR